MDELIEWAANSGSRDIVYLLFIYVVLKDSLPYIIRRVQGRNGSSSMRSQIDKIERLSVSTHDIVISMTPKLDRAQQDIRDIFARCDRRHMVTHEKVVSRHEQ